MCFLKLPDPSPRPSYQGGVNISSYPATPSPHKISDASSGSPSTPETCSEVSVSFMRIDPLVKLQHLVDGMLVVMFRVFVLKHVILLS